MNLEKNPKMSRRSRLHSLYTELWFPKFNGFLNFGCFASISFLNEGHTVSMTAIFGPFIPLPPAASRCLVHSTERQQFLGLFSPLPTKLHSYLMFDSLEKDHENY